MLSRWRRRVLQCIASGPRQGCLNSKTQATVGISAPPVLAGRTRPNDAGQVGAGQVDAGQDGVGEVGSEQDDVGQVGSGQDDVGQVGVGQVSNAATDARVYGTWLASRLGRLGPCTLRGRQLGRLLEAQLGRLETTIGREDEGAAAAACSSRARAAVALLSFIAGNMSMLGNWPRSWQ